GAEIALALELVTRIGCRLRERWFGLAACEYGERGRVDEVEKRLVLVRLGVLNRKETIVETHLDVDALRGRHPVNDALDLAPVGRVLAARVRVVGAPQLRNCTVGSPNDLVRGADGAIA